MAKRKKIIYAEELQVEKKQFFIGTKMGRTISEIKKTFEALPAVVKWLLALFISSVISAIISIAIMIYFDLGFKTIEEISSFLKVQFIIDIVLVFMIGIFIYLVIKEAES